ncbi:hypothetical protein [Methylocystis bryophila]|uniref:Uncharacterized protein n=1 Tax=Methylocystis bryophila TaxID=655015 RepID=A0A1W6MYX2_9HYPH|nr:hypothetical protein [Methylocystis bryophila]ARN82782.1 hypothetical protein B1812_18690 [Methylocystis bryophila]
MRRASILSTIFGALFLLFAQGQARAEGGAGPEAMTMGNMCMVMFGYDMIHITSYLPGMSRSEYCEEIPATGKVIMVFDIENPRFRDLPIEIRIIRDPLTPVTSDTKLDPLTEVHFPATRYRTGTFSFEHDYMNNGHYIGMVTLTKESGEQETQIFKFSVGETLWQYVPYLLGAVLIGMLIFFYWRHSHPAARKEPQAAS